MIRFRIVFLVLAVITLLILLAPILLGIASAIFTYHGQCYGFTDGSWPCTWQEYLVDQVFWSSFLEIPFSMYLLPSWFVAFSLWFYLRRANPSHGFTYVQTAFIPIGGYVIGFGLISILPIFIRYIFPLLP